VLAGGMAYRLFLWLLPFGLIVGGVLGLGDAKSVEDAAGSGGLPGAVVSMIGDIAREADANSWWLLLTGLPLLLWEGYAGARAVQLIHALVWDETPQKLKPVKSSLAFTGAMCLVVAVVAMTWWLRDQSQLGQIGMLAVTVVPLAGLWLLLSLWLPHGSASWPELLPGALLVAIGLQVTHGLVVHFFAPKLESATSLYGALGVVTTLLFFMWLVGRIVVTAPILNSALHDEREARTGGGPKTEPTLSREGLHRLGRRLSGKIGSQVGTR
jgi:membrane protein